MLIRLWWPELRDKFWARTINGSHNSGGWWLAAVSKNIQTILVSASGLLKNLQTTENIDQTFQQNKHIQLSWEIDKTFQEDKQCFSIRINLVWSNNFKFVSIQKNLYHHKESEMSSFFSCPNQ